MSEKILLGRGKLNTRCVRVTGCNCFHTHRHTGRDRPALKLLNRHVRSGASLKWHDLGLELLEQEDEEELNQIQINNHHVSECCKEMFQLWLRKCPNATWNQLIQALRQLSVGLNSLADKIDKMLIPLEDTGTMFFSTMMSR